LASCSARCFSSLASILPWSICCWIASSYWIEGAGDWLSAASAPPAGNIAATQHARAAPNR